MNSLIKKSDYFLKNTENLTRDDIFSLQEIIREHNSLYYNSQDPVITDREYDDLFKILKSLEEKYNVFDPNSPTKRIDVLVGNQFQKWTHISPMISLDNTYDTEDILDFEKRIRNILKSEIELHYIIELKFDWLGTSITYKNGKLLRALTRGNWVEGEDITVNALQINSIPKEIPFISDDEIEIRWEVVMPFTSFEDTNKKRLASWEKLFANPRNAASGSLRQIDYTVTRDRNLEFFAYSFPYMEDIQEVRSYSEEIDLLSARWFLTSPYFFKAKNIESVANEIIKLTNNKPVFPFDIDWLVLKIDNLSLWQELWTTEHHPRYAIAYKFPATNVRTKVLDIEHSVWRTWVITPIAHLEPVNVSGVVVSRATLHNYDELTKKDVRIGDSVFIVRAWEVIPEVISVIIESRTGKELVVDPPELCPSCQTLIIRDTGKVAWYCPNKKLCPAQTLGSLISFVSKHWANIEWLWDKIIELFIEKWLITDFTSIYKLHNYQDEILSFEWFKDKKLNNILDEVDKSRAMPLANFFVALWIPQVGRKTAKTLVNYLVANGKLDEIYQMKNEEWKIKNLPSIVISSEMKWNEMESRDLKEWRMKNDTLAIAFKNVFDKLEFEELQNIRDIWPVGAHSIVYYFEEFSELVYNLLLELNISLPIMSNQTDWWSGKLAWKSFCVTGSFPNISRDEIHKIIEENVWETRTSVTKNLTYLIVWSEAWSKLTKATELWVAILTIEEFMEMVG